jgi:hypothetical protein
MSIHPILDRMYADRVIYCVQPWCARACKLTPARLFIGLNGKPQMPACCDCASAWQAQSPQPVELWYIDDDLKALWWEGIDGALGSGPPPHGGYARHTARSDVSVHGSSSGCPDPAACLPRGLKR